MDVDGVCNRLLARGREGVFNERRSGLRVAPGVWDLDFGDEDRLFRLTVQEVPRRRLNVGHPLPVGTVDGLTVELTKVELDTAVRIHLAAATSAARDELAVKHATAFARWSAEPSGAVPDDPAERLMQIGLTVTDDLGTTFAFTEGQAGGTESPFTAQRAYRPTPPQAARQLILTFSTPSGPDVRLALALPPA